jgi:heme exporter protein D
MKPRSLSELPALLLGVRYVRSSGSFPRSVRIWLDMMESSLRKAYKDTEACLNYLWYQLILGGAFLIFGIGALLLTLDDGILRAGVIGLVAAFLALVLTLAFTFLVMLVLAPYRQRNETIREVEKRDQRIAKLEQQIRDSREPRLPQDLINKAQEKHWDGVEAHLKQFLNHFLEINLQLRTYYRDYGEEDEVINEEIRSHFPNVGFWQEVEDFKKTAFQADSILEELDAEIRSKSESEVAALGDTNSKEQCITANFLKMIVELAISSCLGKPDTFHKYEWLPEQSWQTYAGHVIAVGIKGETKHQEYVDFYTKDERCENLATLVKRLRLLRASILNRMQRCIGDAEYKFYFCSRCPVKKQANHDEGP